MSADAAATEAADADVEAARVINTPVDAEIASVVASGVVVVVVWPWVIAENSSSISSYTDV